VVLTEFRIKYDRVADAIYIRLRDEKIIDSDENGEVVGIEVLQASKRGLGL